MQPGLFHDSVTEAIREVVFAAGGYKRVGHQMRPELSPDEAGRWLSDCLNPERKARLDPEQVFWVLREGRRVGCHALMQHLAAGALYEAKPIEPEDERARLQREFVNAVDAVKKLAAQLERAGVSNLQVVK